MAGSNDLLNRDHPGRIDIEQASDGICKAATHEQTTARTR